jgi:ATP-dependent Clp protease ATP-binding subunit ClpC
VFERFTDRARRVLVLAQEEARLLNHGFIGTEHLLLGLIREGDGIAARALAQLEISLEAVREMVEETIGLSATLPVGSPAFTPRAKKVLELSLREAIQLGHNYIGTEHMLLGLVREGEGVAAQVLVSLGADLMHVRETVVRLLANDAGPGARWPGEQARVTGRGGWSARSSGRRPAGIVACSFCGRRPPETGQLFSGTDAFICEHCVRDWFASLSTAHGRQPLFGSHRTAVGAVETAGPPPEDEEAARAQIAAAYSASTIVGDDGQSVPSVERGANLAPVLLEAQARSPFPESIATVEVDHVVFVDSAHAAVSFTIAIDGVPRLSDRRGDAVLVDRTWKMARTTFCELMMLAGVECPPEPDR